MFYEKYIYVYDDNNKKKIDKFEKLVRETIVSLYRSNLNKEEKEYYKNRILEAIDKHDKFELFSIKEELSKCQ